MSSKHFIDPARNCDAIEELIPDYAFGLTNTEETHLVESNLTACPEAARQLADFQCLQVEMRVAVPQLEPPAHLAERLMVAIAPPVPTVIARRRPIRWGWLAAAVAFILLISTNLYWTNRVTDLTQARDELAASIAGQQNTAFLLTNTSGLRWVRLPPAQQNANTSAFMMWNAASETGLLYVVGFPQLVAGQTYQLWLTRGETRISAGTFRVDDQGRAAFLFHSSAPIDQFTWARITAEPENGSTAPSGTEVVVGKLTT